MLWSEVAIESSGDVLRVKAERLLRGGTFRNRYCIKVEFMVIPPERLTVEVLRDIAESYIVREGTDYGEYELSLQEKVDQLMPQVFDGRVLVVFDEDSETVNLISADEFDDSAKLVG